MDSIKPRKLKIWLSRQEPYTSHHSARRRFQRPRVISFSVNYQWDSDTANMTSYREHNNGYSHFVVFIDIFSRFLHTAPIKTLTGKEMVYVMNDLFQNTTDKPKNLRTERVIKTIKLKNFKYFTSKETFRWIEILTDLTYSYNQSYHRSIKMTPHEANQKNNNQVWKNQYAPNLTQKQTKLNPKIKARPADSSTNSSLGIR